MTSSVPLPRRRTRPLQHSFHVLTDGSEWTGDCGCIVLTIHPTATSTIRYALSGLCEQVARIAADQRFPLHHTRAVFCSNLGLEGLASLLLTLQQAGAPALTICGPNGTCHMVEGIVETVLHKRTTHPKVHTCEIQKESNEWFRVYQDDYLVVHAKNAARTHSSNNKTTVCLVYTVLMDDATKISFAILPPGCSDTLLLLSLPEFAGQEPLDFVLLCNTESIPMNVPMARRVWQISSNNNNTAMDDGLLIRAQYHAQQRHDQYPFLYPYNRNDKRNEKDASRTVTTCSTWRLGDDTVDKDSYKCNIWESCRCARNENEHDENAADKEQVPLTKNDFCITADENEIDLDDADDNDNIPKGPHLLVLGTGCASPSPHRASSGYVLFLPSSSWPRPIELQVVIECGEGFVTQLQRHLPPNMELKEQLTKIRVIWISHAHLDHYGGLPSLLRAIEKARLSTAQRDGTAHKRLRCNPPLVIAPQKVLRYLGILLSNQEKLFEGITHGEWEQQAEKRLIYMPFQALQSVAVEHCPDAYALLLTWRVYPNTPVLLCYSGDCRPSLNLIHASYRHRDEPKLTLLLHEATFDDNDADLARSKRHSTVSEALWVANEMKPDATLLTHFSQRYVKMAPKSNNDNSNLNYGQCHDGLWLPLMPKALSNVYKLKS